jgi:hypothetical protein
MMRISGVPSKKKSLFFLSSLFWFSLCSPNHSLLLINDLKHKGQVYIDDMMSNTIVWDKLFRRWLVASVLLPLYILYSTQRRVAADSHEGRRSPSRLYRIAMFCVGTLYWLLLFSSSLVYFFAQPEAVSLTEVLLPLALHFFCFFVEALLCSIELTNGENFDNAADRIMCKMQVTGTSYAWNDTMDTGFLPAEIRSSAGGAGDEPERMGGERFFFFFFLFFV